MKKISMKKSHAKKEAPVFRLHIDAVPVAKIHRTESMIPVAVKSHAKANKIWVFVWDKIQFLFVSVVVFAVIYVGINWGALLLNIQHYWSVAQGETSPLEHLVQEKTAEPEKVLAALPLHSSSIPQISIPTLGLEINPPDMRIVIPRINQNVPVVGVKNENLIAQKWENLETDIQKALRNGVIHYPGTALPGEGGNVVLTGHSSYYAWDPGRFKDVFSLLHDVRIKDRIVLYYNQKKYIYEVAEVKVVLPKDVNVLGPTPDEKLTLITCTPIGTNLKRLILTAKLVEKS